MMALGKNPRGGVDRRSSSSSYCSTVTLVVFVGLCLVGVWMMTSSAVAPVQRVNLSPTDPEPKITEQEKDQRVAASDTQTFEDTPGDLPDDAIQGDGAGATQSQDERETNTQDKETVEKASDTKEREEEKETDGKKESQSQEESELKQHSEDENGKEENEEGRGKTNPESEEVANDGSKAETKQEGTEQLSQTEEKEELEKVEAETQQQQEQEQEQQQQQQQQEQEQQQQQQEQEQQQQSTDEKTGKEEESREGKEHVPLETFPAGAQSEILNETNIQGGSWSTQAVESKNEKQVQEEASTSSKVYTWKLCNVSAGPDYIPCLDNDEAIRQLRSTKHYEHRERHCPKENPTCLVPLTEGYKCPIEWPQSRDKIWYQNVPHTKLAVVKGHQNWVKVSGEYLTFPGGGTQFKHGALLYIDFIEQIVPDIAWGKRSRVILDVGCGVASFGGYLFDRDVLTMSFAPKDEHEAQVQFALERGIPGISAVMGTQRLPFPSRAFDVVHCARCRVPWHIEGGKLLLELNRVLRPGGYFVWSATPVYQKLEEDVGIWNAMAALTKSMCWKMVVRSKDKINEVGAAVFQKPLSNECYNSRQKNEPPLCQESDDPNAAWYVPLQACMHRVPTDEGQRGSRWPETWPQRLEKPPYWLNSSQVGVYGKAAAEDFTVDYKHWKRVVSNSYLNGLGISWSKVRNVMDMRAVYGGFAAALRDIQVWVMNVVPIDSPDTLPIIYERGLFGIYHDWCESFSTYPRTYDLLHADHLFSKLKTRCNLEGVLVEADRILRPEGKMIVRDAGDTVAEVEKILKSMHWDVRLTYTKDKEALLVVKKSMWRPKEYVASLSDSSSSATTATTS
ncbi:hypothetical protein AMTRI_Chr11g99380 [Amborella trichopoda]